MMKNKLDAILPSGKLTHSEYSGDEIYIADYTSRTQSDRNSEVSCVKPENMDVLSLKNSEHLNITASIFGKQCFMDEQNKEISHCECVLSPTESSHNTWVLFVEIKDCKPKNVSKHIAYAKEQIVRTVQLFRDKSILEMDKKVHAVISFPRNKTDFYHKIPQQENRDFIKQHKIIMRATNTLSIKNGTNIV
jgi:hypothetical protein